MAVYYLRSTDGADTPGGTTWATAFATLQYAATQMAAGDTLWVSQVHVDSQAGNITVTFPGMINNPCFILCGNDAAEPPTVLATTATFGASGVIFQPFGYAYIYGIHCQVRRWEQFAGVCSLTLEDSKITIGIGSPGYIIVGNLNADNRLDLINTDVETTQADDYYWPYQSGVFTMRGGSLLASSLTGTNPLIKFGGRGGVLHFRDVDMSSLATYILTPSTLSPYQRHLFERCKLNAGVTVINGPIIANTEAIKLHSCSSANTTYEMHEEHYSGSIIEDTGIYRTAGASDGTTNVSWAMSVLAGKAYPFGTHLVSLPIAGWTDSTTPKTFTVEIARDGSATPLNDDEIWLELEYPGTTAQGLIASDRVTDFVTTPAAQASSAEAWTGLGGTNVKQKLSVTVTPGKAGPITARVHMATAGAVTMYVDPVITEA